MFSNIRCREGKFDEVERRELPEVKKKRSFKGKRKWDPTRIWRVWTDQTGVYRIRTAKEAKQGKI